MIPKSLSGGCKEIQPSHFGASGVNIYNTLIERTKNPKCCDCGEDRKYLLVVHHKDGSRDNNAKSNLEIVCSNCHMKRHLYKKNNQWVYWSSQLTDRTLLKSL